MSEAIFYSKSEDSRLKITDSRLNSIVLAFSWRTMHGGCGAKRQRNSLGPCLQRYNRWRKVFETVVASTLANDLST